MPRLVGRAASELTAAVLGTYGQVCHLCSDASRPADSADHIIPVSLGGDNTIDNCRPAHKECNAQRQAMSLADWYSRTEAQYIAAVDVVNS